MIELLLQVPMAVVIIGHLFFAYGQVFKWPEICKQLLGLEPDTAQRIAGLGHSFASYNAAIAVGLLLSFRLDGTTRDWVQGVVLLLIVATAAVGTRGTKGNTILKYRLLPAVLALVFLLAG